MTLRIGTSHLRLGNDIAPSHRGVARIRLHENLTNVRMTATAIDTARIMRPTRRLPASARRPKEVPTNQRSMAAIHRDGICHHS